MILFLSLSLSLSLSLPLSPSLSLSPGMEPDMLDRHPTTKLCL
jgi:hypothetical protein